jgi:hypothetical protein
MLLNAVTIFIEPHPSQMEKEILGNRGFACSTALKHPSWPALKRSALIDHVTSHDEGVLHKTAIIFHAGAGKESAPGP